jgi:hypothetical protein
MKGNLLVLVLLIGGFIISYSQPTNIYQPYGNSTNFGKVTSDSLNYYVVNYPALTLMKIDGSNKSTLVTTLSSDPFQTMIWNNGKGIFPVSAGLPFKLFDGKNQIDITGGQLPLAGYTGDKVIFPDYFHKGNFTYFRTNDKIYKTDYTSASSIKTLFTGIISEMQHTTNSIIFSGNGGLNRIDLTTGIVTTIDPTGSSDYGTVYKNEYYYCTPYSSISLGKSKVYKVSDDGTKTVLYTETAPDKSLVRIIGVTPKGVIAIIATAGIGKGSEYFSISGGIATALNFKTNEDAQPCGSAAGSSRTTSSLVYFETLEGICSLGGNRALWVTDGTLNGTKKVLGGPPTTFEAAGLSPQFPGSAEHCDNDLYFNGKNGANANRLIYVNGSNYAVTTFSIGTGVTTQPSFRKAASRILFIVAPLPTSSAEKAVYKVNCSSITSINDKLSNQISFDIFPNPANDQVTVSLSAKSEKSELKIYNMLGENVYNQILTAQLSRIHLNLKSGMYFVNVLDESGNRSTRKLIVQ